MEMTRDGNLPALLRLLLLHWVMFISLVAIGAALGVVHYVIADRVFEAEAVIEPARDADDSLADISSLTSQLGSVASLAGLSPSRGSRYDQAVAMLTSIGFFEKFDRRVGFRDELRKHQSASALPWRGDVEPMTIARAHTRFHGEYFRLIEDPTTSVVWLRVRSWDPNLAALWANELIETLNESASQRDRALSDATLGYLEMERSKTQRVETQQAISALMRRESERRMLASVSKNYAFNVIDAARASDVRDFVAPQLAVSLIFGLVFGCALAGLVIVLRYRV